MSQNNKLTCWCGNQIFSPFSEEYVICNECKTLLLEKWADETYYKVTQDDQSFYGKSYWFTHQEKDLGFNSIITRARSDIPERALYWAKTLLKYKEPSGKALEIGCAHGGFVFLLKCMGFDASGLELSPWVVDFARDTFNIPMYLGDIAEQDIPSESLDAILMMDVLEHLQDPVATLETIKKLLKPNGILVIQTPCYPETRSYTTMKESNDPFLLQLKPPEHLFLFSKMSIEQLLKQSGFNNLVFEKAYFSQYDMFLVASLTPLLLHSQEKIDQSLLATPGGRLILALLDKDDECRKLNDHLIDSKTDGEARLSIMQEQAHQIEVIEADRAARLFVIQELTQQIEVIEADRAARLSVIREQERQIEEIEADRAARLSVIQEQQRQIEEIEDKRTMRLSIIEKQAAQIDEYKLKLGIAENRIINLSCLLIKGKELLNKFNRRNSK